MLLVTGPPDILGIHPAWAAVIVAATVGLFSAAGIWTARKSYKDNAWQTKVRVARVVYTFVEDVGYGVAGELLGRSIFLNPHKNFGRNALTESAKADSRGNLGYRSVRSLVTFQLAVHNASDEPLGDVEIQGLSPTGEVIQPPVPMWIGKVLTRVCRYEC